MSVHRVVIAVLFTFLVFGACAQEPRVDTAAETEKIRQLSNQWQEAVARRDIDACTTFYAPDGIEMPDNSPVVEGREAIYEWYLAWLPDTNITNTFQTDLIEVAASGDLAYERGSWYFSMETPEGPFEDMGKYVLIWKKIDGDWKAIVDIANSDLIFDEE